MFLKNNNKTFYDITISRAVEPSPPVERDNNGNILLDEEDNPILKRFRDITLTVEKDSNPDLDSIHCDRDWWARFYCS